MRRRRENQPDLFDAGQTQPQSVSSQDIKKRSEAAVTAGSLYLAVSFPALGLEILAGKINGSGVSGHLRPLQADCLVNDSTVPFLVYEEHKGHSVVYQTCAQAMAAGIVPGMRLSAAYALCPTVHCLHRDCLQEQKQLHHLADWAGHYSADISLVADHGLLIEIKHSLKLFGGLSSLLKKFRHDLQKFGYQFQWAVAPTPMAAFILASNHRQTVIADPQKLRAALANLSVSQIGLNQKQVAMLRRIGVHELHELWRLPRAGLGKRFGRKILDYLDLLLGDQPDPRFSYKATPVFSETEESDFELTEKKLLLRLIKPLLVRLSIYLKQIDAGCDQCQLVFFHARQPPDSLQLAFRCLTRGDDRFYELIQARLEQYELRAPIVAVQLQTHSIKSFQPDARELFAAGLVNNISEGADYDSSADAQEWERLLEDLAMRISTEQIVCLESCSDHRPDYAWRYVSNTVSCQSRFGLLSELESGLKARPGWLLPKGVPLQIRDGHLYWYGVLRLVSGPERIEGGWWEGRDIQRDYYVAESRFGQCYWVYRNLKTATGYFNIECYRAELSGADPEDIQGDWYLHGLFA